MSSEAVRSSKIPNVVEFAILLALARGDLHGYAVMQEVERQSDAAIRVGPGTFYGAMKRMLANGWIEEVAAPEGDDPRRRRLYRLTRGGRVAASTHAEQLAQTVSYAAACGLIPFKLAR